MKRIIKFIKNKHFRRNAIIHRLARLLSDDTYLKLKYKAMTGLSLNLKKPIGFNEKLQWLKIYDRKPIYTKLVDKYEVKEYLLPIIGQQYIIPTYGIWENFDEIDFDSLPDKFVLKTTHGGGGFGVYICTDKSKINLPDLKKKMNYAINQDASLYNKEWPYKNVKKRFLAEKLIDSSNGMDLMDYKFFCFGGKVKFMKVDFDRFSSHKANYYDKDFNLLPLIEVQCPPDYNKKITKPHLWDEMIEIVEKISEGIPFARIDLYYNGAIYFSEVTFYPASGFGELLPIECDKILGEMLDLSGVISNNK